MEVHTNVILNPKTKKFFYGQGHIGWNYIGKVTTITNNTIEINFPRNGSGWRGNTNEVIQICNNDTCLAEDILTFCVSCPHFKLPKDILKLTKQRME